jgi:DNA-binding transcriptional ArsR family regulator
LYLDGEMPAAALQIRLREMVLADERDFDPTFLRIATPDIQDGHAMPDLATHSGQAAVEAIIDDAELVIVDNVSTLVRNTQRENDAESWREVGAWALQMRQRGRAVLFIHHSGKDLRQRGSSKREDTLDVVMALRRPSDYLAEQGARFEIHFEKYRNGSGEEAKAVEAWLAPGPDGKSVWTYRDVEDSTFDRVVALANEGLNGKEIADEIGINKSNVSRHLSKARTLGLLTKAGP